MSDPDQSLKGTGRPARPLAATIQTFDLAAEASSMRDDEVWQTRGHNAKTLVKHPDFRIVLMNWQE